MPDIRPLTTDLYEAWLPLWHGYLTFYKSTLPEATSQESFRRMLDPTEPTHGALIFHNDQPLGLVHWIFHRSNWSIGDYCYLQDLFVSESARGLGLGRALIEHVYAQAALANASRVYWLTHETNTTAMELYNRVADRSGFIQYRKLL